MKYISSKINYFALKKDHATFSLNQSSTHLNIVQKYLSVLKREKNDAVLHARLSNKMVSARDGLMADGHVYESS